VPTYQYACTECGDQLEAVQKFTDAPLSTCSACGGRLRKVFSPVGIVFKGSGFYRTDSRNGSAPASASAKEPADKKSGDTAPADSVSANGASPGKDSGKAAGTPAKASAGEKAA